MSIISFEQRLSQLQTMDAPFAGTRRGLEKEALRVQPGGQLAQSEHPLALGSALTHPNITTDFAESQLEFVTPAMTDAKDALDYLADLHRFSATRLDNQEFLWGASMPAELPAQADIPLAQYGSSSQGQLKTLYRRGLSNRYGSAMQTISGIHYNFSLPTRFWEQLHALDQSDLPMTEYISAGYFGLIRNVLRHGWLIPYLFGASPVLDSSLVKDIDPEILDKFGFDRHLPDTLSQRWATSLRLSDLGYTSETQSHLGIRYDSRATYLADLSRALQSPADGYRHLGRQQQINSHVLQLENELYSSIRPKRVSQGLRPLHALCRDGVEYIELRSLDINPLLPLGLDQAQSRFIDLFLITMALLPSPQISAAEQQVIDQRLKMVIHLGRKPGLMLPEHDDSASATLEVRSLKEMGKELITRMMALVPMMDDTAEGVSHLQSLLREMAKLDDPALTPSAQILAELEKQQASFRDWTSEQSRRHTRQFASESASPKAQARMAELAALVPQSLAEQARLEAQPQADMDSLVASQTLLNPDCQDIPAAQANDNELELMEAC